MLKFGEACFKAKHRWPSSTHYSSLVSPWTLKNTMFMITVFNGEDTLTSCPVTERLPLLAAALCTTPQELPPSRFRFLSTTLHTIISGLIKIIQMSFEKTVSCDGPLISGDALFFFLSAMIFIGIGLCFWWTPALPHSGSPWNSALWWSRGLTELGRRYETIFSQPAIADSGSALSALY